jgi:hypothetical protein
MQRCRKHIARTLSVRLGYYKLGMQLFGSLGGYGTTRICALSWKPLLFYIIWQLRTRLDLNLRTTLSTSKIYAHKPPYQLATHKMRILTLSSCVIMDSKTFTYTIDSKRTWLSISGPSWAPILMKVKIEIHFFLIFLLCRYNLLLLLFLWKWLIVSN